MPRWIIRTRDDKGNTEMIRVRAQSAAQAIQLAEIDLDLVYSITNELGTGRGKYERAEGIIRVVAIVVAYLYFFGILFRGTDSTMIEWSELNFAGRAVIVGVGVLCALGILGAMVGGVIRFCFRNKFGKRSKAHDAAEVLARRSTNWELYHYMLQHPAVRVLNLIVAIGLGFSAVSQVGAEEPVEPFLILIPFIGLWVAAHAPLNEMW